MKQLIVIDDNKLIQLRNNLCVLILLIYLLCRCNILLFLISLIVLLQLDYLPNSEFHSRLFPPNGRKRGSGHRSRRCREDRPSCTRVCRREERRSISTSLSRGVSPGRKPVTSPPFSPPHLRSSLAAAQ